MRLKTDKVDFISITLIVHHGRHIYYHMLVINFVKTILIQKEECDEILINKNSEFKNKILSLRLMIPPN